MINDTMNLYYQGRGSNFGDAINYNIFSELFGLKVKATRPQNADCLAIGSILQKVLFDTNASRLSRKNLKKTYSSIIRKKRPIHILGSGFIEDVRTTYPELKAFLPLNVIALRGKLSRAIMEEMTGQTLEHIPLGDPGLLVSEFIKGETIVKKYKLGIIPHIVDKHSPIIADLEKEAGVTIIDIESPPLDFLRKTAACETIASTSLHGLITADSLHIPNAWIRLSDGLLGGDFKFLDYYSIYGITPSVLDLRKIDDSELTPQSITERYSVDPKHVEDTKSSIYDTLKHYTSGNIA